jgi:hypothetical protein
VVVTPGVVARLLLLVVAGKFLLSWTLLSVGCHPRGSRHGEWIRSGLLLRRPFSLSVVSL